MLPTSPKHVEEFEKNALWGLVAKGLGAGARLATRGAGRLQARQVAKAVAKGAPKSGKPAARFGGAARNLQITPQMGVKNSPMGKRLYRASSKLRGWQGGALRRQDQAWANKINRRSFAPEHKDRRISEHANRQSKMKANPFLQAGRKNPLMPYKVQPNLGLPGQGSGGLGVGTRGIRRS